MNFLKQRKKAILIFVVLFIFGFALGYYIQILRVYQNCLEMTGNPNCKVFLDYF